MKRFTKLTGLILVLVMLFAFATTVLAVNITIDDENGTSSYEAYRLLNATNSGENFAYTLNATYENILKEVTGKTLPADIIDYISELDDDDIRAFADEVYAGIIAAGIDADETAVNGVFSDVNQGYYLIAETAVSAGSETDTISLVMLDTAGESNITVETKEGYPTVEKKVKDTNDSTGETTGWQDSADHDIGDTISYKITGTVSSEYAKYKEYYYSFTDELSAGLTVDADDVSVHMNSEDGTDITAWFDIDLDAEENVLTITCDDLKAKDTNNSVTSIVVLYTVTLNEDAVIGSGGNPNTVTLTYSNNPYQTGEGTPDTNTTAPDTNIVFTYKAIVNKVDEENEPLEGAGFTLYKFVKADSDTTGTWTQIGEEIIADSSTTSLTTFGFNGLDDGQYKLVETTVPAGYNKADDIEFTIVAEHDEEADAPELITLVVKNADGDVISDGSDAVFSVVLNKGEVSTDVVNTTGLELPSTGGVGTTIFYVLGGILVVGAVVLIITKKRMNYNA